MKLNKTFFSLTLAFLSALTVLAQETNTNSPAESSEPVEGLPAATNEVASTSDSADRNEWVGRQPLVAIGKNADLPESDSAEAVVAVGGSAKVRGKVHEAVVAVGGDVDVDSEVGESVVAVFGNIHVGKNARLHQQVVSVFGHVEIEKGAVLDQRPVEIDFLGTGAGLQKWLRYCGLWLRPMAPQVGWVWLVALVFACLYFLISCLFRSPVQACVTMMHARPATTFLVGFLTKLFFPLVMGVLAATGIGLFLAPFVFIALIFGTLLGKTALFEYFGGSLGKRFNARFVDHPSLSFLVGILMVVALYNIPVIGLFTFVLTGIWGLGGAAMAAFAALRREMPRKAVAVPSGTTSPPASTQPEPTGTAVFGTDPAVLIPPVESIVGASALAEPRAGFLVRIAAALLDSILIGMISSPFRRHPIALLIGLAYFSGFWFWRGTTIGGLLLHLKVVRLDGQKLSFPVALVRALAAGFSAFVCFLGFFWIIWDKNKQGWHDKIAGTVVVRASHSTPLI